MRCLALLEEHAVEHREDDVLLGLGEAADALELALELGRGAALAGAGGAPSATPRRTSVGTAKKSASLGTSVTGRRRRLSSSPSGRPLERRG